MTHLRKFLYPSLLRNSTCFCLYLTKIWLPLSFRQDLLSLRWLLLLVPKSFAKNHLMKILSELLILNNINKIIIKKQISNEYFFIVSFSPLKAKKYIMLIQNYLVLQCKNLYDGIPKNKSHLNRTRTRMTRWKNIIIKVRRDL